MKRTGVPLEPGETGWTAALFLGIAFAVGFYALYAREFTPVVLIPASLLTLERFWRRPKGLGASLSRSGGTQVAKSSIKRIS